MESMSSFSWATRHVSSASPPGVCSRLCAADDAGRPPARAAPATPPQQPCAHTKHRNWRLPRAIAVPDTSLVGRAESKQSHMKLLSCRKCRLPPRAALIGDQPQSPQELRVTAPAPAAATASPQLTAAAPRASAPSSTDRARRGVLFECGDARWCFQSGFVLILLVDQNRRRARPRQNEGGSGAAGLLPGAAARFRRISSNAVRSPSSNLIRTVKLIILVP